MWKGKGTRITESILKKKIKVVIFTVTYQKAYKSTVIKTVLLAEGEAP